VSGAKHRERTEARRRFKPYPTYKDAGVEWLGQIPIHWEVKRLRSTVTSCQNGVWGDEPDGVHDIACVRVADFDRVAFRVEIDEPTMRSIDPGIAAARGLQPGDLLLEKSGGGEGQPVGAVVLFDHEVPAVCSNFVARVTIDGGHNARYQTYLHAALYALRINTRHIKQSTGIQNLDSSKYLSEAVGLPPEPEQCAIAAFLDRETARIDALVTKKGRLIELLQEKRTALISRAVTKGLDPNVPMKDTGVDWLGEIPAHWECLSLSRVTLSRCDGPFGSGLKSEHYVLDGVRVIRLQNIGWADFLEADHAYIGAEYAQELGDHSVVPCDLLIAGLGDEGHPVGRACVAPDGIEPAIVKADCFRFRLDLQRVVPRFAAFQLSATATAAAGSFATGATRARMNLTMTASRKVALPPPGEQRTIVDALEQTEIRFFTLIAKVRDAIERLKELRTALISAAVTGKIDVRNASASP
jgi:type I restriction enzyme S subunit